MPFVQKLPEWNKAGTEPPASLKNTGWQATQKPPADYFNWLQYTAYMALKELQEKAQHKDDFNQVLASATAPINQSVGGLWFEVGTTISDSGNNTIIGNATVSNDEPADKRVLWFDKD